MAEKKEKEGIKAVDFAKMSFKALSKFADANIASRDYSDRAFQYSVNSRLANTDANEALRVGMRNVQVVNVERALAKGEAKAEMSASGFVVGVGTSGDMLEKIDTEFAKTMAAYELDARGEASALEFEAAVDAAQSNYMKKLGSISRTGGIVNSLISAGTSYAMLKAGEDDI